MLTVMFTGQRLSLSFTGRKFASVLGKVTLMFARNLCLACLAIICVLSFAAQSWANGISRDHKSGIDLAEIDKRASQLMQQLEMVGLSVAIVDDGEMSFAKGYGEVQRDSNMVVTADTVFRWASVSKGVAAATVLSLQEDGHFDIAQPAKLHASSLKLPPSEVNVTIEDILSHRVGIVRNAYDRRIEDGRSAKDVRSALKNLKYLCDPGTCHTYQNVAFDASSEIIESITGLPYKSVVQERIFDPLGMETASVTLEGLKRSKSWARPHGRSGIRINRVKENYYRVPAAAGINSSVKDLAKWMIAQMPPPQIDSPEDKPDVELAGGITAKAKTAIELIAEAAVEALSKPDTLPLPKISHEIVQAMQAPRIETPRERRFMQRKYMSLENAQYGLGWRTYDYAGHRVIGHRGGVEGYRALVLFDPEKRSGIAMMWNSPHSRPIGLQLEFMDQLYGLRKRDWLRLNKS